MASACQAPLRPQSPVTVTVGGDSNKKRVLEGSIAPPPSTDTQMDDGASEANGHQPEPAIGTPAPAYNPADVVSDLSAFVSNMLGHNAGSRFTSSTTSFSPSDLESPMLLIYLAIAKKLEDLQTTTTNANAKADHAQQVATSALNTASAAANASRTYAQMTATPSPPKPPPPTKPTSTANGKHAGKARPQTGPSAVPNPAGTGRKATTTGTSPESPKPPQALPPAYSPAQRRLFVPLGSPQKIPNGSTLLQTLPALLANLLLEKKLPREAAIFTATINDNGTVSLTAPKGYAAGYYAPYYDQLAKATQQHIAPDNNTYEAFRPAPTSDSLLINRVPISALPSDPALLQKAIADAVHLATGIAVGGARTLLPWDKITKLTTSLVIQVPPTDAPILIKKGILLFNRVRPVRAMWSATPATQCTLCWQFGHPAAGCPKGPSNAQCCRICGDLSHTARTHPCLQCLAEPSLPKKTDGVCPHASPYCTNCGAEHTANSPSCPKRVEALAEQRARANKLQLVRGSPPS